MTVLPHFSLDTPMPDVTMLADLCADCRLVTREITDQNAYYGHDRILKAYAGLAATYPLKVMLPHAVQYNCGRPAPCIMRVPVLGYYTPERVSLLDDLGITGRYWPFAMPFVYLMEMIRPCTEERRGTVIFPGHSVPGEDGASGTASLAERVAALGRDIHPLTVCMFWWDVRLGRDLPFRERVITVLTAGHPYDPNFLVRLYRIISRHRYVVTDAIGSHLFYAIKAGCRYFPLPNEDKLAWGDDLGDPILHALYEAVRGFSVDDYSEQLQIADHHLGVRYMLSSKELRSQLRRAELFDKLEFAIVREPKPHQLPVLAPAAVRRGARAPGKAVRRIGRRLRRIEEPDWMIDSQHADM